MSTQSAPVHPEKRVRVRFAPSPTGYLHVGGARTAIFNWLFARHMAKKHGGDFLLRVEDTDQSRYDANALVELIADLKWLGLDWDEGPEKGGPHEPYFQSQRLELYQKHAGQLVENGSAYRCFCTPERIEELREQQKLNNLPPSYDRRCRNLSVEDSAARVIAGDKYVVRLKSPFHGNTVFKDLIRGIIDTPNRVLDDLVLLKTDGFPTYHLANVVDDHAMEITHVLRGDEWIPSTPRHILIYAALGWEPPIFCHLPVILAEGGGKLSKRKGAASVGDYRDLGYLPEVMVNFLSLLGWSPGEDLELMETDVLIEKFSIDRIHPKSAVFDEKKLEWMNGQYFLRRTPEYFLPLVKPLWAAAGVDVDAFPESYLLHCIALLKDRSKRLPDFVETGLYFFRDPDNYEEKTRTKHFGAGSAELLESLIKEIEAAPEFSAMALERAYKAFAERNGRKGGDLIHPTRLAISGIPFGPGLYELMEALGKDVVLRRLRAAIQAIRAGF